MIDTIQLKIPEPSILVERESFFHDETYAYTRGRKDRTRVKSTNWEFYKKKQSEHVYVPKFWREHTTWNATPDYLVLEFSVPKLLFGTSLYAVNDSHFDALVDALILFLRNDLHIKVDRETIEKSIITQLACCRNIRLDDMCTANQAIKIIENLNYIPRSKVQRLAYEDNTGYGIKFYNSARSLGVYEKLPEIMNNAVTAIEIDIAKQWRKNRVVEIEHMRPAHEVARFELTLQNKKAVNQALAPFVGKKKEYTLADVFQKSIADQILVQSLDEILNHPARDFIFMPDLTNPILISAIKKHVKTRMHESEIIAIMRGIQELGIKGYRKQFLSSGLSERTWRNRCLVLKKISQDLDWTHLPRTSERDILLFLMKEFEIEPKYIGTEQLKLL